MIIIIKIKEETQNVKNDLKEKILNDNNNENKMKEKSDNKEDIINKELKDESKEEKLKKENILSSIIQLNNKLNMDTLDLIKRNELNTYDKEQIETFIKLLELNNRKMMSLKIFCLYNNNLEKSSFFIKKNSPEKFYFNKWYKNLIVKKDE